MTTASELRPRRWWMLWATCYAVLVGMVVWSLFYARQWALAELATPQSVGDWQACREDVQQQDDHPGPVERQVPKSVEPPALVLMRDYFGVSLGGTVVFTTVLYLVIAWFVMGAMTSGSAKNSNDLRTARHR